MELRLEAPDSAAAQWCLEQYFAELSARFDGGFDPARSISASADEMTPPAGFFALALLEGAPAGCGVLKVAGGGTGEIKRMWTAPHARGLGVARQVLRWLETRAREARPRPAASRNQPRADGGAGPLSVGRIPGGGSVQRGALCAPLVREAAVSRVPA
ncbi:MAG TPA: GNAT family N-acetyltransferase [Beijerinckiaceae bacterium]|nr:GNAT family N-acetyltransferase [Beijerinckiaceae bacterium]